MRRLLLACVFLAAPLGSAGADPIAAETAPSEVTVTFDQGSYEIHTVNRRFEPVTTADNQGVQSKVVRYLVKTEIDRTTRESDESEIDTVSSIVRATARPLTEKGLGDPTLKIETKGDEVATSGPFLIVTNWGCCAEQQSHAVYSMQSGRKLFSATGEGQYGDWITLGSQHKPYQQRIAVAHVAMTPTDAEELGPDDSAVMMITYAGELAPLQRLAVRVGNGRNPDEVVNWYSKLAWVNAQFPDGTDHIFISSDKAPAETYTDMSLRIDLEEGLRIEIPLIQDRLAPDKATLPTGFSVAEVPIE